MQENLGLYTDGGICTFERRILMTKWVANAWHDVCKGKEATVRSFKKCGLSVKLDGSEDDQVNVEGMPNYTYRMEVVVVYLYLTSAKCTGIPAFSLWPEATALTEMVKVELHERKKMKGCGR